MEAQLATLRISVGFGSKLAVELRVEPTVVGSKDLCNKRWDIVEKGKKMGLRLVVATGIILVVYIQIWIQLFRLNKQNMIIVTLMSQVLHTRDLFHI